MVVSVEMGDGKKSFRRFWPRKPSGESAARAFLGGPLLCSWGFSGQVFCLGGGAWQWILAYGGAADQRARHAGREKEASELIDRSQWRGGRISQVNGTAFTANGDAMAHTWVPFAAEGSLRISPGCLNSQCLVFVHCDS